MRLDQAIEEFLHGRRNFNLLGEPRALGACIVVDGTDRAMQDDPVRIYVPISAIGDDRRKKRNLAEEFKAYRALQSDALPKVDTIIEDRSINNLPVLVTYRAETASLQGLEIKQDLRSLAMVESLPVERRLVLVKQLMESVAQLHSAGLIHGSLGPHSIDIDAAGRQLKVDVLAFGSREEEGTARMTPPAFLAPEDRSGNRPDMRCDVYAAGMLAYAILLGPRAMREAFLKVSSEDVLDDEPGMSEEESQRWHNYRRTADKSVPNVDDLLQSNKIGSDLGFYLARLISPDPDARPAAGPDMLKGFLGSMVDRGGSNGGGGGGGGGRGPGPELPPPPGPRKEPVNWVNYAMGALIVAMLAGGGFYFYKTIKDREEAERVAQARSIARTACDAAFTAYQTSDAANGRGTAAFKSGLDTYKSAENEGKARSYARQKQLCDQAKGHFERATKERAALDGVARVEEIAALAREEGLTNSDTEALGTVPALRRALEQGQFDDVRARAPAIVDALMNARAGVMAQQMDQASRPAIDVAGPEEAEALAEAKELATRAQSAMEAQRTEDARTLRDQALAGFRGVFQRTADALQTQVSESAERANTLLADAPETPGLAEANAAAEDFQAALAARDGATMRTRSDAAISAFGDLYDAAAAALLADLDKAAAQLSAIDVERTPELQEARLSADAAKTALEKGDAAAGKSHAQNALSIYQVSFDETVQRLTEDLDKAYQGALLVARIDKAAAAQARLDEGTAAIQQLSGDAPADAKKALDLAQLALANMVEAEIEGRRDSLVERSRGLAGLDPADTTRVLTAVRAAMAALEAKDIPRFVALAKEAEALIKEIESNNVAGMTAQLVRANNVLRARIDPDRIEDLREIETALQLAISDLALNMPINQAMGNARDVLKQANGLLEDISKAHLVRLDAAEARANALLPKAGADPAGAEQGETPAQPAPEETLAQTARSVLSDTITVTEDRPWDQAATAYESLFDTRAAELIAQVGAVAEATQGLAQAPEADAMAKAAASGDALQAAVSDRDGPSARKAADTALARYEEIRADAVERRSAALKAAAQQGVEEAAGIQPDATDPAFAELATQFQDLINAPAGQTAEALSAQETLADQIAATATSLFDARAAELIAQIDAAAATTAGFAQAPEADAMAKAAASSEALRAALSERDGPAALKAAETTLMRYAEIREQAITRRTTALMTAAQRDVELASGIQPDATDPAFAEIASQYQALFNTPRAQTAQALNTQEAQASQIAAAAADLFETRGAALIAQVQGAADSAAGFAGADEDSAMAKAAAAAETARTALSDRDGAAALEAAAQATELYAQIRQDAIDRRSAALLDGARRAVDGAIAILADDADTALDDLAAQLNDLQAADTPDTPQGLIDQEARAAQIEQAATELFQARASMLAQAVSAELTKAEGFAQQPEAGRMDDAKADFAALTEAIAQRDGAKALAAHAEAIEALQQIATDARQRRLAEAGDAVDAALAAAASIQAEDLEDMTTARQSLLDASADTPEALATLEVQAVVLAERASAAFAAKVAAVRAEVAAVEADARAFAGEAEAAALQSAADAAAEVEEAIAGGDGQAILQARDRAVDAFAAARAGGIGRRQDAAGAVVDTALEQARGIGLTDADLAPLLDRRAALRTEPAAPQDLDATDAAAAQLAEDILSAYQARAAELTTGLAAARQTALDLGSDAAQDVMAEADAAALSAADAFARGDGPDGLARVAAAQAAYRSAQEAAITRRVNASIQMMDTGLAKSLSIAGAGAPAGLRQLQDDRTALVNATPPSDPESLAAFEAEAQRITELADEFATIIALRLQKIADARDKAIAARDRIANEGFGRYPQFIALTEELVGVEDLPQNQQEDAYDRLAGEFLTLPDRLPRLDCAVPGQPADMIAVIPGSGGSDAVGAITSALNATTAEPGIAALDQGVCVSATPVTIRDLSLFASGVGDPEVVAELQQVRAGANGAAEGVHYWLAERYAGWITQTTGTKFCVASAEAQAAAADTEPARFVSTRHELTSNNCDPSARAGSRRLAVLQRDGGSVAAQCRREFPARVASSFRLMRSETCQ